MIEVDGADRLAALAKQLRAAGNKDLQRELGQAINRAMKPLKQSLRASAKTLPARGGLAKSVSGAKLATRRRSSARVAGVRLVATSGLSLYHLNEGTVRHYTKTPRALGRSQAIAPGWWDRPTEEAADDIRAELTAAMDAIARKAGA